MSGETVVELGYVHIAQKYLRTNHYKRNRDKLSIFLRKLQMEWFFYLETETHHLLNAIIFGSVSDDCRFEFIEAISSFRCKDDICCSHFREILCPICGQVQESHQNDHEFEGCLFCTLKSNSCHENYRFGFKEEHEWLHICTIFVNNILLLTEKDKNDWYTLNCQGKFLFLEYPDNYALALKRAWTVAFKAIERFKTGEGQSEEEQAEAILDAANVIQCYFDSYQCILNIFYADPPADALQNENMINSVIGKNSSGFNIFKCAELLEFSLSGQTSGTDVAIADLQQIQAIKKIRSFGDKLLTQYRVFHAEMKKNPIIDNEFGKIRACMEMLYLNLIVWVQMNHKAKILEVERKDTIGETASKRLKKLKKQIAFAEADPRIVFDANKAFVEKMQSIRKNTLVAIEKYARKSDHEEARKRFTENILAVEAILKNCIGKEQI